MGTQSIGVFEYICALNSPPQRHDRKSDVVVLFLSSSERGGHVKIHSLDQLRSIPQWRCTNQHLVVDLTTRTWSWKDKTFKIGQQCAFVQIPDNWGPMGVYDRTNMTDLSNMVYDTQSLEKRKK